MAIKSLASTLIMFCGLTLCAQTATAVSVKPLVRTNGQAHFVAPKLAERAIADVQIRRIKHLISIKKIDHEVALDRWEKLQNQLRDR